MNLKIYRSPHPAHAVYREVDLVTTGRCCMQAELCNRLSGDAYAVTLNMQRARDTRNHGSRRERQDGTCEGTGALAAANCAPTASHRQATARRTARREGACRSHGRMLDKKQLPTTVASDGEQPEYAHSTFAITHATAATSGVRGKSGGVYRTRKEAVADLALAFRKLDRR